jgi:hypothetical protein
MLLPMAEEGLAGGAGLGAEQAHVALVGRQVFGLDMIVDVGGFAPRPTVNAFPHSCGKANENPPCSLNFSILICHSFDSSDSRRKKISELSEKMNQK